MADAFFEKLVTMDAPKGAGNVNFVLTRKAILSSKNTLSNSKSSGKGEPLTEKLTKKGLYKISSARPKSHRSCFRERRIHSVRGRRPLSDSNLHEALWFQDFGMRQRKSANKNNVPVRIIPVGMELARSFNAKI